MRKMNLRAASAIAATIASICVSTPVTAYPVDCAILLCLAGGWPASAVCSHARAVFIARITPWPIEPPLQIWNCPMRASLRKHSTIERLFEVSGHASGSRQLHSFSSSDDLMRLTAGQADVDISDDAFDFVRSIRVFEITYQQRRNREGDCSGSRMVFEGSYGRQGEYNRYRSSPAAVPAASDFDMPSDCKNYWYRSVFVEWRDYKGTYGHEEVHY